jgi:Ala-tRNA(Pro) deacylase
MTMPTKLVEFLETHHLKYETIAHSETQTSLATVNWINCDAAQLAKIIVCEIDNYRTSLFLLPAAEVMDLKELKKNINAKKINILPETKLEEIFNDCEIGAQPTYGSLYNLPTFLPEHSDKNKDIYFNAGTHTDVLRVPYSEFDDVEQPYITNFSRPISRTIK